MKMLYFCIVMPRHKPIKFETSFNPTLRKLLMESVRSNQTAKTITNTMLAIAALGGVLSLGVLAPNVIGTLGKIFDVEGKQSKRRYQDIWNSFNYMRQRHMFEFLEEKDGYAVYRPSLLGMERIKKLVYDELVLPLPKSWDGLWRLVIFDVPKHFHKRRDALRRKLKDMDFYQCQKSVWIHPLPCLPEIEFVKEMLDLRPFVKIFLVQEMTDGKTLYYFKDLLKELA